MSDSEESYQADWNSTLLNTTQRTIIAGKDWEVPKLRRVKCEDYVRWKRGIEWWEAHTRVDGNRRAVQIILPGNIRGNPEMSQQDSQKQPLTQTMVSMN